MDIKNLLGHKFFGLVVLLYAGLIAWLSLASISVPMNREFSNADKLGHLSAYFVFTCIFFVFLFYSKKKELGFNYSLLVSAICVLVYGVLMEFLQANLTTYRSAEWLDVFANTTGVFLAVFILRILQNKIVK